MDSDMTVRIGKKAFLSTFFILLALIIFSGILTQVLPTGEYQRLIEDGRQVIVPGSFQFTEAGPLAVYRWFLAPVLVLAGPDSATIIVIIIFILLIGGSFAILNKCGLMHYVISIIVQKFRLNRFLLLRILILAFMLFGSVFGLFEETVILVPVCVALAYSFRWDAFVGLGLSTLATGLGFTAATFNPFTVGVAQKVAELPLYSGVGLRFLYFAVVYIVYSEMIVRYARKIEAAPERSIIFNEEREIRKDAASGFETGGVSSGTKNALKVFLVFIAALAVIVVTSFFITALSQVLLPVIAIVVFLAGITAGAVSKYGGNLMKDLGSGMAGIAPSVILILMAVSVKYIITEGMIVDTLLFYAQAWISQVNPFGSVIFIYVFILVMNFLIPSGSAKALLIIPLISGLSEFIGVTRQTMVLAYSFGDGFTDMLYPTNPILMITLSLTVISYPKWIRWSIKYQLMVIGVSVAFLLLAVAIGYGPF